MTTKLRDIREASMLVSAFSPIPLNSAAQQFAATGRRLKDIFQKPM